MKKTINILIILSLFIQTTNHLWIIGLFKLRQNYISANYCVNRFDAISICKGSCYLEKQLTEQKSHEKSIPNIKLKEIQLFCNVSKPKYYEEIMVLGNIISTKTITHKTCQGFLFSVFRPPIV